MRIDTIVAPRGAEAGAVERGWAAPRPQLVTVAAGLAAAERLAADVRGSVLVMGVCGALDPALRVGDVVAYARVRDAATTIELDAELSAACAALFGRAPVTAAAVSAVVGDVREKAVLRTATGAAVIDMEGAVLARALHARGARVAMVRVVSDDTAHDLPDLRGIYDASGALKPLTLTLALVRTPARGIRFIRNALRALRALREAARRLAASARLSHPAA